MARRLLIVSILLAIFLAMPAAVDAASLYLSPSSGSYTTGDSFNVTVGVNTDGVAINSAQATVSFSTATLEVSSISSSGIFTLWPVNPTYSNAAGTVTFAGGVPSPGFTGSAGTIITITFKAKAAGTASASIGSGSVLANDGFGTDILTSQGSASYTVAAPVEEPPPPELEVPARPTISSSTHPDQGIWYSDANPAFSWSTEDGVNGYSFAFDDQEDTVPDTVIDSTDSQTNYSNTGDGVWYFHVKARNDDGWGPTGHYKVQIDTTPPLPFNIDLLDGKRTTVTTPRLSFETTDATSGIHHYDLITDNGDPVGIDVGQTTPYTLPELEFGKHDVTAIAYDLASNDTSASNSFTIVSPDEPPPVVIEEVKEEDKPLAEKITETIEKILPAPLEAITDTIGETFDFIKESEAVTEVVDTVVEPVVTTTAIIAATSLAAAIATTVNVYNLFYLFFRFGYFWLVPIVFGKKRKRWGTVFDSITGKPVARAVVRIYSREFNKLKETQITDSEGRFGFLVDKGSYYVTVAAPGYVFPSHIIKTASISQYDDIYRGDTLEIQEQMESVLSMNIPIDPNTKTVSQARLKWLKIVGIISRLLDKISMPLLVIGTVLSWATLIIEPKSSNYIVLSLYAMLILLRYVVTKKFGHSVGMVKDKDTAQPIETAIVRIFNADTSIMASTRITNAKGQFNALLAPGNYYLVIVKQGYEKFQSRPVKVSKTRAYIRFTAELMPIKKQTTPLEIAHDKDIEIHLEAEPGAAATDQDSQSRPPINTKPSAKAEEEKGELIIDTRPTRKIKPTKRTKKRKIISKKVNKDSHTSQPPQKNDKPPSLPKDLGDLSASGKDS